MNLYVKYHPHYFNWLIDDKQYNSICLTNDFIKNCELIFAELKNIKDIKFNEIYIEKPFLRLQGADNKKIASDLIQVQRLFGAILFILHLYFGVTVKHLSTKLMRDTLYNSEWITKDTQISEAKALLKGLDKYDFNMVQLLSLHDCLVIKSFVNKGK